MTSDIKRLDPRIRLKQAQVLREKMRKNNDKIRDLGYDNVRLATQILKLGFGIPQ